MPNNLAFSWARPCISSYRRVSFNGIVTKHLSIFCVLLFIIDVCKNSHTERGLKNWHRLCIVVHKDSCEC